MLEEDVTKFYNFIREYNSEKGSFPNFSDMIEFTGKGRDYVINLLRILEKNSLVKRKVSHYFLSKGGSTTLSKRKAPEFRFNFSSLVILKLFCGVIGAIIIYLSCLHSFFWYSDKLSFINSILFSIGIVGFLNISSQLVFLFLERKNYLKSIMTGILFLISIAVSTSGTVSGHKRNVSENIVKNYNSKGHNSYLIYKDLLKRIERKEKELEQKERVYKNLVDLISRIKDYEGGKEDLKELNYRLFLKEAPIKEVQEELDELILEKKIILDSGTLNFIVEEERDFFSWLEGIFKIKGEVFEFILYLMSGLFLDLMSPVCFFAVFFLKEDK